MILRDYHCTEHGYFEGWQDACPIKGCSGEVSRVFLQAVGIKSDSTKNADKTIQGLANDFKMTDIKSVREGESQAGYLKRNNTTPEPPEQRPGSAALWGGAGAITMQSVMGGQFKPVRDEAVSMAPKEIANFQGPKAASYVTDHENLKIKP